MSWRLKIKDMDAELYAESVNYEKLTQAVYQAMLAAEGVENIEVEHNLEIEGRSGVKHQIDVSWRFTQAGVNHHVLVECKNYSSAISLEKIRSFFAVLHDIGNCQGLMVTKTGYQDGVVRFADFYGIRLKLLRPSAPEDWEGRVKDIHIQINALALATGPELCPKVQLHVQMETEEEEEEFNEAVQAGEVQFPSGPEMVFVDEDGSEITDEFRWWLPRQLAGDGNAEGGPYSKIIKLEDHYLNLITKGNEERRVPVKAISITYYYEKIDTREFSILGAEIVEAFLMDFGSKEVEYVRRRKDS